MKTLITILLSLGLVLPAAAQVSSTQGREVRNPETIQVRKEAIKNAIEVRRDALKAKLQSIKDERKKAIVERIDQNLADLNARMSTHYTNVLGQISDVLTRVISRTDKAQANGKDVASVRTAISTAQSAIATARAAVAAQAAKVYTLNITGEGTLRKDISVARQALHDDLAVVRDLVKAAREAVRKAAVTLAQIRGVDEEVSTSTTTSTNQ